jgi:hypothetical protein
LAVEKPLLHEWLSSRFTKHEGKITTIGGQLSPDLQLCAQTKASSLVGPFFDNESTSCPIPQFNSIVSVFCCFGLSIPSYLSVNVPLAHLLSSKLPFWSLLAQPCRLDLNQISLCQIFHRPLLRPNVSVTLFHLSVDQFSEIQLRKQISSH